MYLEPDFPHAGAPTYATYPKPEWFVEAFDASVLNAWLATPRAPHMHGAIAVELRLPAPRERRCLCGVSACASKDACLERLLEEMALYRAALGARPAVCDLRWSSGCAALPRKALKRLHAAVLDRFGSPFATGFSVHVDPLGHDREALPALRELGAHSIQIGSEPCDRLAPPEAALAAERTASLVAAARAAGFCGIEAEYRVGARARFEKRSGHRGRPGDLPGGRAHFGAAHAAGLDRLVAAGPTRVVLSEAATTAESPGGDAPAAFADAAERLARSGYAPIAEGLFALASDPYAIAHRQGHLTCRAGGYAARPVGTVLGIGPGAIGQVGPFYYQNHRTPAHYLAALDAGRLPIERGLHLSHDELARRAVISSLATNLFVDVPAIESGYGIDFARAFGPELHQLHAYEKAGLLAIDEVGITLTPPGRLACGAICRVFDARNRQLLERTPLTTLL